MHLQWMLKKSVIIKMCFLVDDIYTTGSTIDAKILVMAGVEKVYFVRITAGMDK